MTLHYIDTNIFLNVVYDEPRFAEASARLLQNVQDGKADAVTASITETEIGLDLAQTGNRDKIDDALRLIEGMTNLRICSLDPWGAKYAISLVIDHGLTVHDAYHGATAIENRASVFVTRDQLLKKKLGKLLKVSEPEALLSR